MFFNGWVQIQFFFLEDRISIRIKFFLLEARIRIQVSSHPASFYLSNINHIDVYIERLKLIVNFNRSDPDCFRGPDPATFFSWCPALD